MYIGACCDTINGLYTVGAKTIESADEVFPELCRYIDILCNVTIIKLICAYGLYIEFVQQENNN